VDRHDAVAPERQPNAQRFLGSRLDRLREPDTEVLLFAAET
jgi:hypothetical protein